MAVKFEVKQGDRFNSWEIIKEVEPKKKSRFVLCRCLECGKEYERRLDDLRLNKSKMCKACNNRKTWTKHGFANHKLYGVLKDMHSRCEKPTHHKYYLYGERGISVCDEWADTNEGIKSFIEWSESHGYKEGLQIDRIDNDKGYSPDNCRWVDVAMNNFNRRGTKGYRFHKGRWEVYITKNGKFISAKCDSEEEAIELRKKLEIALYGENSPNYR